MWFVLLADRDRLLDRIFDDGPQRTRLWRLIAVMTMAAAIYGAALGSWHGARLAFYDAIKLPLVLLLTSAVTALFNWVVARVLGIGLRFSQVVVLTFVGLATAAIVLASLAPIAWFFTLCAPAPGVAARTTHNGLYLLHTVLVGACGVVGSRTLWRAMQRVPNATRTLAGAYVLWMLAYAVVGGEIAWALRPFVGSVSPDYPLMFLRQDALTGNVYEFIGTDIVPYLLSAP